jgi:hypothetical protein
MIVPLPCGNRREYCDGANLKLRPNFEHRVQLFLLCPVRFVQGMGQSVFQFMPRGGEVSSREKNWLALRETTTENLNTAYDGLSLGLKH